MLIKVAVTARALMALCAVVSSQLPTFACSSATSSGVTPTLTPASKGASVSVAEQQPDGSADGASNLQGHIAAAGDPLPQVATLINAQYALTANALGLNVCSGTANLLVNASLTTSNTTQLFKMPSGGLDCSWLGTVNIAAMLGAFSQSPPAGQDPLVIANNVIALSSLGSASYEPPRPLLPAFLSSSPSALASLNLTVPNIVIKTASGSDSGTVNITMNSYDQPFTSSALNMTFAHVMDFTVTNTGFSNIDRVSNFIFDSIEFKISTNPVAILAITLVGPAKGLAISAGNNPGAATGIIGSLSSNIEQNPSGLAAGIASLASLSVTLTLSSQQGLATELASANTDSSASIGEKIGGVPTTSGE